METGYFNHFILRCTLVTADGSNARRACARRRRAPGERVHDFKYVSTSQARTTRPDLTLVFTELQTKSGDMGHFDARLDT